MSEIAAATNPYRALFGQHALYVPRTPWGPVSALLVTVIACAMPVFAFGGALIFAAAIGGEESADQWSARLTTLTTFEGVAVTALSQLFSVAIIWMAAGRGGMRRDVLRLGEPKPNWLVCVIGGLIVVAAVGALELVLYGVIGFDPFADSRWLREGLESPYWWGTVFIAVVLAPLWEEFAFRGFLLSALAQTRLGFWPAAVISTALWTLLHWGYSWAGLASVFAAGIGLSWLMWRTGSMRAVVVAHALANVVALLFVYCFAPPG